MAFDEESQRIERFGADFGRRLRFADERVVAGPQFERPESIRLHLFAAHERWSFGLLWNSFGGS